MAESLNKMLESSFRKNWNCPALSDYKGVTLHYRDVARRIEKIHIVFERCGTVRADAVKVAGEGEVDISLR